MSDLIEDHERGCAGREYTCTCGYDDAQADRIAALEAEVDRLRKAGDGLAELKHHRPGCLSHALGCDCGLTEALTHRQEVSNG